MATVNYFEDLEIWKLARDQTIDFFKFCESSPLKNDFELKNQMNKSSGSVMDCIAEGFERSGNNEFRNFLTIAKASNGEYRSQLFRCLDRNYLTKEKFEQTHTDNLLLGSKIYSLIKYLANSPYKGQRYKKEE